MIYEQGLRLDLPNIEKARLTWELGTLFDKAMCRRAEAVALAERGLALLANEQDLTDKLLLQGLSYSLLAQAVWFQDSQAGASAAGRAIEFLELVIRQDNASEDIVIAYLDAAWAYSALGNQARAIELCQESMRLHKTSEERVATLMILSEALRVAAN